MNLTERLLKADAKIEKNIGTFKSKKLARIFREEEPVDVEIREISPRRQNDITMYAVSNSGAVIPEKLFDMKLMLALEGISSVDFTDKNLQKHFNVSTPKDLCEKIFGSEINDIADEIIALGGVEGNEQEIKN